MEIATLFSRITTFRTPAGFPAGTRAGLRVSYEDMSNPMRMGTVVGFYVSARFGIGQAIVQWEDGEDMTATDLRQRGWSFHDLETVDLGNNESMSRGIVEDGDGFLALTFTQSKRFKTRAGAQRWLDRRSGRPAH